MMDWTLLDPTSLHDPLPNGAILVASRLQNIRTQLDGVQHDLNHAKATAEETKQIRFHLEDIVTQCANLDAMLTPKQPKTRNAAVSPIKNMI